MNRLFLQGPSPRTQPGLRAALLMAGVAVAVGSLAAMSLTAAPAGDVIGSKRGQIRMLEAEVQRIDAEAASAADAHAAAVRRADDLRARIAETTRGIAQARAARIVALERLSERVVGLYAQPSPSLMEVLVAAGGLTAAIDAQETLEAVGDQDRRTVDQIEATRDRLTRLRAGLEGDRAAVESSVAESSARLAELRGLIASRRAVLDDARATLDRLVARDADRRAGRAAAAARAAAAEAAAERELLRRADPSTPAAASPGVTVSAPIPPAGGVSAALQRIAECESGGNPQAVSGSGQYRGKYQFDPGTWESLGGSGDPAAAPEAEQDRIAAVLYARSGPAPWPVCGYR